MVVHLRRLPMVEQLLLDRATKLRAYAIEFIKQVEERSDPEVLARRAPVHKRRGRLAPSSLPANPRLLFQPRSALLEMYPVRAAAESTSVHHRKRNNHHVARAARDLSRAAASAILSEAPSPITRASMLDQRFCRPRDRDQIGANLLGDWIELDASDLHSPDHPWGAIQQ